MGGCLPKDLRAFASRAAELGVESAARLLDAVDEVNLHQRLRTVELASTVLGGTVRGRHIAVLGAAFKAGSDDIRDSPALAVATTLAARGARVAIYDPQAGQHLAHHRDLRIADSVEAACSGSDLTMVLTDWPAFSQIDPVALSAVVSCPTIVDARLCLDVVLWRAAGWEVHALGRPRSRPTDHSHGELVARAAQPDLEPADRDAKAG